MPTDEYQQPPDDERHGQQAPILVPAEVVESTLHTLNVLDEYFRIHARTTARAQLRVLAGLHGLQPLHGADVLINGVGFNAHALTHARDTRPALA